MADQMRRRGKKPSQGEPDERNWYGNTFHQGTYIGDCLGTSDRRLAERELARLKVEVEGGRYKAYKKKFDVLTREYRKEHLTKKSATQQERADYIIRLHLLPWFGEMRISEINDYEVYKYVQANREKPQSSMKKILRVLAEIVRLAVRDFELPKLKFENKGKKFDETQILDESEVLDTIHNHVYWKYRLPCLVSMYSALRLGNVVGLKRKNVDLKTGWIEVRQTKTGKPVSIPICGKLREVFAQVKVWPMRDEDLFFPGMDAKAMSIAVGRAFKRAGIPFASFHHLRHFAACFLINNGVRVEIVQKIMGHTDINSTLVYARLKRDTIQDAMKVFDNAKL